MIVHCPFCKTPHRFTDFALAPTSTCSACDRRFMVEASAHPVPKQLFLDIETTGFRRSGGDDLTSVVWYGDGIWGHWANDGRSPAALIAAWTHSQELITYNGEAFDEPWLINKLGLPKHPHHTDLRADARRCGLQGGLKEITQFLGIDRPQVFDQMEGGIAPKLWKSFCKGNRCSLCNLLYYNAWDVVLTYKLYCRLKNRKAEPIETLIPIGNNPTALRPFLRVKLAAQTNDSHDNATGHCPDCDQDQPLAGRMFCFTGELQSFEREEAEALVCRMGGVIKQSAVKKLDYLVVGHTGEHGKTSKIRSAEQNIATGSPTQIIGEDQFRQLVDPSGARWP